MYLNISIFLPAWTAGWRVLTLPLSISGAPVILDTSFTERPAALKDSAVPPDAIKDKPSSCNFLANGKRFVLSETLNNAEKWQSNII